MQIIDKIYIGGAFVKPHGDELFDLFNPATEQVIGRVLLADAQDARDAIAAAKRAFAAFSRTGKSERIEMLKQMHSAVVAKEDELYEAITEEYGAPVSRGRWMARHASSVLLEAAKVLTNDMAIAREEIFGPVLSIITYRDTEDAISIANDTNYGLQAYVFSADVKRAREVAARIEAGRVLVNTLAHEPAAPFGGFKQSGIGREYGTFGLEAFLEPQAVLAA